MRLNFRVRDGNGWDPHDIVTAMAKCEFTHSQQHRRRKGRRLERETKNKQKNEVIEVLKSVGSIVTKPSTY